MKNLVRSTLSTLLRRTLYMPSSLVVVVSTAVLGLASLCGSAIAQTPQSSTTRYEYDANGNLIRIIDPLGRATVQRYDAANRLVQQLLPSPVAGAPQPAIAYGYDAQAVSYTHLTLPTIYSV